MLASKGMERVLLKLANVYCEAFGLIHAKTVLFCAGSVFVNSFGSKH